MSSSCGFDSVSSTPESSDCLNACLELGCSVDLLLNSVCDSACNSAECGFDGGSCGYCASNCFESDLLNSIQDSDCDSMSCFYDTSLFKECSPSCTHDKLLNAVCDFECNTSLCLFDLGNCDSTDLTCSEECMSFMLGNGICNPECNNLECSFDDYDCLCAPECTSELLSNSYCDQVCNSSLCGFDNGLCQCPQKCQFLGTECDLDCWNQECNWMDTNCGCAENCAYDEITSCKTECLVIDCDLAECTEPLRIQLASTFQIIKQDFHVYIGLEDCLEQSSNLFSEGCTEDKLRNDPCFLDANLSMPCYIEECGYALGKCSMNCESKCGSGSDCYEIEGEVKCITCCTEKFQFYTDCLDLCPSGYEANSDSLCVPKTDMSAEDSPAVYYVSTGLVELGTGTENDPFSSISVALGSIHTKYTEIYLENNQHYPLTGLPEDFVTLANDRKMPMLRQDFHPISLTIKGNGAYLEITGEDFMVFNTKNKLVVESVIFTVESLKTSCSGALCKLCPALECRENCENIPDCSVFGQYSLFEVSESSTLELFDVKFQDIRANFLSLIKITGGDLKMNDVDFIQVRTKDFENNGIIMSSCENGTCGNISYENGEVKMVNDGYDLVSKSENYYDFSGFMYLLNVNEVLMNNLNFTYNLVYKTPFIYIDTFKKVLITQSNFTLNLLFHGMMILENSNFPDFSLAENTNNTIHELTYDNFELSNTEIKNNYIGNKGVLYCLFEAFSPNIKIENINLMSNLYDNAYFFYLENQENPDSSYGFQKTYIENQRKLAYFPEKTIKLHGLNISNSGKVQYNLIQILNFHEVDANNIEILITDDTADFNQNLIDMFITQTDTKFISYFNYEINNMEYFIGVQNIENFNLNNLNVSGFTVYYGSLLEIHSTKKATINNIFLQNIYYSHVNAIVNLKGTEESYITNSIFQYIINYYSLGSGVFKLIKSHRETAYFDNCTWTRSTSFLGVGIESDISSVSINNSLFKDIYSSSAVSSTLFHVFSETESSGVYKIANSTFENNETSQGEGAALKVVAVAELTSDINLTIQDCHFENQVAFGAGAAIILDQGVKLNSDSIIENSVFRNNTSYDGVVGIRASGRILIECCEFECNEGKNSGGIYVDGGDDFTIEIQNSEFRENHANSILLMETYAVRNYVITENCRFEKNIGSPIVINHGEWEDSYSMFVENQEGSVSKSGSIINYLSVALLDHTSFISNNATNGAAISLAANSILNCDYCTFLSNTAEEEAGALFVSQSLVTINHSSFKYNSSILQFAGAISITKSSDYDSVISNTEFAYNSSGRGFFIVVLVSKLTFASVTAYENNSSSNYNGILIDSSILDIQNSEFFNQSSNSGSVLSAFLSSVYIDNSKFYNCRAIGDGGALLLENVTGEISNSEFYNITSNGGIIHTKLNSSISINSCKFHEVNSDFDGIISLDRTSSVITGSEIRNYTGKALSCRLCFNLRIDNSTFIDGSSTSGTGLVTIESDDVIVENSYFENMQSTDSAGAVKIESLIPRSLIIFNSTFTNCSSTVGGALHISNALAQISNNTFIRNTAATKSSEEYSLLYKTNGIGGAVYSNCDVDLVCEYIFQFNEFRENTATYNGGGIYWEDVKPELLENVFISNSAEYGNEIASVPVKLAEVDEYGNIKPFLRLLVDTPVAGMLNSVASGQLVETPLLLALVDHYNQVVSTDNESKCVISSSFAEVAGTTIFIAYKGIFNLTGFSVVAVPDSITQISVSSSSIVNSTHPSEDYSVYPEVLMEVEMRPCILGEVNSRNECVECPETTYSLDPSNEECSQCEENAICNGGYDLQPKPGYWRSSITSSRIWRCPNKQVCKGYTSSYPLGECETGYKGNKCQSCETGYTRIALETCIECPRHELLFIKIFLVFVIIILFNVLVMKMALKTPYKSLPKYTVYIKIFINYLQMTFMAVTIRWSVSTEGLVALRRGLSYFEDFLFTFDCLINDKNEKVLMNIVLMGLHPALILFLSFIFWLVVSIKKKDKNYMKEEFVYTFIVMVFLFQPLVLQTMFMAISCTEIEDGEFWLEIELDVRCWDSTHTFYVLLVFLPTILLLGIALPIILFSLLRKNRRQLHKLTMKKRYGFLYAGYSNSEYYWEILIMARKFLVIFCSVFLSIVSVPIQALCFLLIMILNIYLHLKNPPFVHKEYNHLEIVSMLVIACNIYSGLFFSTQELPDNLGLALDIFLILLNSCFVLWYFVKMLAASDIKFLQRIRIFKYLFPHSHEIDLYSGLSKEFPHIRWYGNSKVYSLYSQCDTTEFSMTKFNYNSMKELYLDLALSERYNEKPLDTIQENDELMEEESTHNLLSN